MTYIFKFAWLYLYVQTCVFISKLYIIFCIVMIDTALVDWILLCFLVEKVFSPFGGGGGFRIVNHLIYNKFKFF